MHSQCEYQAPHHWYIYFLMLKPGFICQVTTLVLSCEFLVHSVSTKLGPFLHHRNHFGQRSKKIAKFSGTNRWTVYALKIEALFKTSSNFVCVLTICKCCLTQVCILMGIHYGVIIGMCCPFLKVLVSCSFSASFQNIFAHFFFKIESIIKEFY